MKLPAFQPKTDWEMPRLGDLPSWAGAKRICVDLETKDPTLTTMGPGVRTNGRPVGVGFAIEGGPAAYLPIGHAQGPNLDPHMVWRYLRDQAKTTKATIVTANGQYDHDYLLENGVDLLHCPWFDVQIADPLIDELQQGYSLDKIAMRHGLPGKDETILKKFAACYGVDPKKGMWQLPAKAVGIYGEQDCRLPLQIARIQERIIERCDLTEVFELESKLQPVLLKMRRRGVAIDFDRVEQLEAWALEQEIQALAELHRRVGIRLEPSDVNKTAAWVPVLKSIGVKLPKTAKTGKDSVTKDFLVALKHPVADLIRDAKRHNKLRTTFCASAKRYTVNGRIHCTFNQLRRPRDENTSDDEQGARYGRLSCVNPNLQQQTSPDRDPVIGKALRMIFVPDEGGEWACLDYSQQEPRWLIHYAELAGCTRASEAAEKYRNDPTTDNHNLFSTLINPDWPSIADPKIKKKERADAKIVFLALIYGMGGARLCEKLGLPIEIKVRTRKGRYLDLDKGQKHLESGDGEIVRLAGPEGRALLKKFNDGAPFVQELTDMCEKVAAETGFIITAGNRRCRFPLGRGRYLKKFKLHTNYDWCYRAGNRLIQGSSGDQIKRAMVQADGAGVRLQLQVHDELDLTIWDRKEVKVLSEIMLNAIPCRIPHMVDAEIGPTWGEIA